MALKKIYFGSVGPFFYDDTDDIDDPDGDFVGETQQGIRCSGGLKIDKAPVEDEDVVRKVDTDPILTPAEILARLLTVDGTGSGLDADLLDGQEGIYYGTASAVTTNTANIVTNTGGINTLNTWKATGVSGSFTTVDSKTVTVTNGLITAIV